MAPNNSLGSTYLLAEAKVEKVHSKNGGERISTEVNNNIPLDTDVQCSTLQHGNQKENSNLKIFKSKEDLAVKDETKTKTGYFEQDLVWINIIAFAILHTGALYGLYIIFTEQLYKLYIYSHIVGYFSSVGVTAGAHRLWAHKAYKAKWPLRLILMILQTVAFQNCIHEWVRDHRVHHKFCDTTADPHNSKRGFFFSHMGWLLMKKHPDVKEKGKTIDMSDIEADPIAMFQKKYYFYMMPFLSFVLPAVIPWYFFGYEFRQTFFVSSILRYIFSLHLTWFVNSAAHLWGFKPYDKSINPSDNRFVIAIANGEGYHNYHHVFPWDYKAAELGSYFFNYTKVFIDNFAKIGWAYDLKTVSDDMIRKRILRTGDGSHKVSGQQKKIDELIRQLDHEKEENLVWGWDDKDMTEEDRKEATIINYVHVKCN
ncbi:acyl-CoA Delta-9 desaturase-like [Condylostylus longicornis]|uniref:acyl-CoA Delta-9 desaturase-like n=1 Tax=Condylostylus longicornis TaxID=2530218 RepID=UPI00244E571C|nr:acyl-CoA Delta-9 desaturase-like [Condylostylus longicornis]XP_055381407.1 acyl-CoA Delta-9 desaturase-like [Condylostylus longicornis]XP_055381415.1 acyl-CoA Delta-9 desaturase-like [Condylostylus longicornis]XP_055381419.1 acyl-CoA Delta-9 desaturase-like [Condylostylus longicornis]